MKFSPLKVCYCGDNNLKENHVFYLVGFFIASATYERK